MKPTVGRIVHYVSYGTPGGEYLPEHRAAIVTDVLDDIPAIVEGTGEAVMLQCVSLCVLNPEGLFFNRFVYQDEDEKVGGTWHWPEREDEDDQ